MSDFASTAAYQRLPGWVLGFHGCDREVGLSVLNHPDRHLKPSRNAYDWLGEGIYFWENDPVRALEFAREGLAGRVTRGTIRKPFVIGAVIDLGLCCNLFDQIALQELRSAHAALQDVYAGAELPLPTNGRGQLVRPLDRLVIEFMHTLRESVSEDAVLPPYQTVRAGFSEGRPLFEGTTITEKHHIQIAVRDPACIKGYFLPRP
ncbi:hypothetical protein [Ramlibacter sp.]|uniref:hypothetical protein n=1 Tax=Ramlibacter sp. TaxID=1917967 RepID=UPI0035B08B5F